MIVLPYLILWQNSISGHHGYFWGCVLFCELDDDVDDLEESTVSDITLNESLAKYAEKLPQLKSSIDTPSQDRSL